ncbi:MAG: 30S ribosomal protein S19e [Candidatus Woesearchaeota archaeon]
MVTVFDVPQGQLTTELSNDMKKIPEFKPPEWASFVKTGVYKQRPPVDSDWWYKRAASVLRTLYLKGPIGVSKLRTRYGGKKNRGVKPEKFKRGSGNIIRKILQQLEKAQFAKKVDKGVHKGRVLSPKGKAFVDKVALRLAKKE